MRKVVFPLRQPREASGWKSPKNGEKLLIPLAGPTPKNGEKLQKNYKNYIFGEFFFPFFGAIFPTFWGGGGDRGGGI